MLTIFRGPPGPGRCLTVEIMQDSDSPDTAHASSRLRLSGLAAGLALLSSALVTGHVWSTAVGVVMALASVVLGIVVLSTSRKVQPRLFLMFLAILAIVWGAFNAFGGGARLAVWPASQIYQECAASALTLSSTSHCQRQLTDNMWNYLSGSELETGPGESSPGATPSESPTTSGSTATSGVPASAESPESAQPPSNTATPAPSAAVESASSAS